MLRSLKEVMKNKTYCEILFADGNTIDGFVTKVTSEDFDIYTIEPIFPEPTSENSYEDEDGDKHYKNTEEFDSIPVKHSYVHGMVFGVVADITHRMKPHIVKSLDFIREEIVYREASHKPTTKRVRFKKHGNNSKPQKKAAKNNKLKFHKHQTK